jgi:hypothetical protein
MPLIMASMVSCNCEDLLSVKFFERCPFLSYTMRALIDVEEKVLVLDDFFFSMIVCFKKSKFEQT